MSNTINDAVRFEIFIRADRRRVYDALTTGPGLDGWFTTGATVDLRPGGEIRFRWKDYGRKRYTGENSGPVLEADVPRRFVFQWRADQGPYLTTVEIDFRGDGDGTLVSLMESGYLDTPEGLRDLINRATGWAHNLTLLKFYLEHDITG